MRQVAAILKDPLQGQVYQKWLNDKSDLAIENALSESAYDERHIDVVIEDMLAKWPANSNNRLFSAILTVKDIDTTNIYFDKLKHNASNLSIAMIYDDSDRLQEGELEKI